MEKQSFQIIFEGKIQEGQELSQVKQRVAELFRVSGGEVDKLFCGKTLVVRRNLSEQDALKYQQAFERAGAICQVVREEPEPSREEAKEEIQPSQEESEPLQEETRPLQEELKQFQEETPPSQEEVKLLQKEPLASSEQQVSAETEEEPARKPGFPPCPNCGYQAVSADDPLITGENGRGKCPACGIIVEEFLQKAQSSEAPEIQPKSGYDPRQIPREDYKSFIGKNADKYLSKFDRFGMDGTGKFVATWHWPAFFFPFFWMLYRKLYPWAVLILFLNFAVNVVPFGYIIFMITLGMTGNYIYYKHAKNKILQIRQTHPSDRERSAHLARAGGVNVVAVVVIAILIPFFLGIVAAIAIPNLLTAIQRSKRSRTAADMRAIGTALGSFQVDHNSFPIQQTEAELSNEILPDSYYAGPLQDAWQTGFRYVSDGKSYKLISYGKDKLEGGGVGGSYDFDADIIYSDGRFIAPEYLVDH
jgi:type II secretory pathway pseudopilin PulG